MRASTLSSGNPAPELALPTLDGELFDMRHRDAPLMLVSFLRHAG